MVKDIINEIVKDGRYKTICRKLAHNHLSDDLYQEFIVSILEMNEQKLLDAKQGNYIEVFCVGVINNIWHNRGRVKAYKNGKTSPLFEYSSTYDSEKVVYAYSYESENENDHYTQAKYNVSPIAKYFTHDENYDVSYDLISKDVKAKIIKDMDSSDNDTMYNSRVFYYSNFKYKNARQFSLVSKINYQGVIAACRRYKKTLEETFKLKLND